MTANGSQFGSCWLPQYPYWRTEATMLARLPMNPTAPAYTNHADLSTQAALSCAGRGRRLITGCPEVACTSRSWRTYSARS